MSAAVSFRGVSKRFTLHHERPRTLQELTIGLFGGDKGRTEELWALKDIDFEIEEGESLGIIGPNGAGKSTILKLVAGIMRPTSGEIMIRGKVSPLLELGAGFHHDLTGRENIYLNAALLGISEGETKAKFQEIVDFSELERFIDVPLKHYSSGMYMRLGFAVAVSVDPAILLIDEVLAVGDEAFQRKCLAKIEEFQKEGRTIIFVSHALTTVAEMCHRALWLDQGRIRTIGPADRVVEEYLESAK
jgi:ABC-type polysaccharide/polyol phosphate transport system ATPase subunit